MNQEELEAKIDAFLWELLPEADSALIEKEIENNPDFRSKVAVRQFEHRLMERMERESLAAKMTAWEAEAPIAEKKTPDVAPEPPPMTPVYRRPLWPLSPMRWAMAATVALLVTVGGSYYWATTNNDSVELAKRLRQNEDAFGLPTTAKPPMDENTPTGYSGVSTAIDDDKQIQNYEVFLKNTEGADTIRQKAEWQLILLYMRANKTMKNPNFKQLLESIATNPTHLFYEDARQLNEKTKGFWWRLVN